MIKKREKNNNWVFDKWCFFSEPQPKQKVGSERDLITFFLM